MMTSRRKRACLGYSAEYGGGGVGRRLALGTLLLIGFVSGVIFWGGFNTGMEMYNTEEFCSCHEMRENVYEEYMDTIHYTNRSGVRATCPDCHVPHEFGPKWCVKFKRVRSYTGKFFGIIDTLKNLKTTG